MNPTSKAVILRVDRHTAGTDIPFDKLYFFERDVSPLIPKIFPFSLVLTLTDQLVVRLKAHLASRVSHTFDPPRYYPIHRRDEGRVAKEKLEEALKTILGMPGNYWLVIPILHRAAPHNTSSPRYLTALRPSRGETKGKGSAARRHVRDENTRRSISKMLDDIESYMLIAGEKYQPICLACANHLEMLNGRCFFGSVECYSQLVQMCPSNFVSACQAYDEFMRKVAPVPDGIVDVAAELPLDCGEDGVT